MRLGDLVAHVLARSRCRGISSAATPAIPSFSTAAFFGLGSYAGALVAERGRADGRRLGASRRSFVGAVRRALGFAILRMRGHYFAVGSIGVVEVVRLVVRLGGVTGGGDGLNVPILTGGPNDVARVFLQSMMADHAGRPSS